MKLFKKDHHNLDVLNSTPTGADQSTYEVSRADEESKSKNIISTLSLLIAAPLLALFITAHVFHSYEVDGSSMEPFLQNGDRLIVYKLPKTIANITNRKYTPVRGDVIVVDRPRQLAAPDSVEHLIKRVIALPGERVTLADNVVTVYNKDNPEGFNPDADESYGGGIDETPGAVDVTLGRNEIFVMGDNRSNSSDSRAFGPVDLNSVVGTAEIRFIPINNMRRI